MAPNDHNHYDTNTYAGDQATNTRRAMMHMPDEDRVSTSDLQQSINQRQAHDLSDGVRMGDDRAIGDTPNWASYDSEQLYKFATENNSPYTADDLGRAFNEGGNGLAEAANGLFDALSRIDGAWTGVASDSARNALKPLASASGTAGQTAQLMGVRMSQQSVAASEVAKLPPAKTFDQQQSLNAMLTGGPAAMQADLKAQKDAADGVKREQISYLTAYTSSMSAVDAQTPSFVPPKDTIGGGGGGGGGVSGERVYVGGVGNATPWTPGSTSAGPGSSYTGGNAPGSSQGILPGHESGQTDQSNYTALPSLGTGSSNFTPTSPSPSTFGPGGGGVPTSNVPGAGHGGFGGGFGSFGSGGSGGSAPGAGSGSGGSGGRPVTPGGMGPGGAGRPGAGGRGMGGAPRGKGDKEEDKEHGRPSYLVEGDPESTFGNDALTAPPVIGDDS